jgi:hypothetical protein
VLGATNVAFAPGQRTVFVAVNITDDDRPEQPEVVLLTLTSASPASVPGGQPIRVSSVPATIAIAASDDVYGSFSLTSPVNSTVAPGPNPLVPITVTRALSQLGSVRVLLTLVNSTAQPGRDFVWIINGTRVATVSSYVTFLNEQTRQVSMY